MRGRTREGNGGVGFVPRGGKEMGERGGPRHDGRQRGANDAAGNSPRPSGASGDAVALIGESGGAWWSVAGCERKRAE
jgi:hypothetical protein